MYSLQATWIRNTVLGAVRSVKPEAAKNIPANIVFAFPTISGLAHVVSNIITGAGDADSVLANSRSPEDLWKYVEKYSANFPTRPPQLQERSKNANDVVLITGTTGGFGCDALEHLLSDEKVERVYAFNRVNSNAMERQRIQFRKRGLDEKLLDNGKLVMVEAALHEPGFGIDKALLEEVRKSITHIMLNGGCRLLTSASRTRADWRGLSQLGR